MCFRYGLYPFRVIQVTHRPISKKKELKKQQQLVLYKPFDDGDKIGEQK